MALTDLIITVPPDRDEDPEDIFAAAAATIFPDETNVMWGDEDSSLRYMSRRFGDIELQTASPDKEDDRRLFAHYLWNAGIKMAEMISNAEEEGDMRWSVRDERVLELGAGVGLAGIVATLAGASQVVISDYPARELLENIQSNASRAIAPSCRSRYRVEGYRWGDVQSEFAVAEAQSFMRIIAADCYWMLHEHENLARSMLHFLHTDPLARVLAIAGFHTGRAKLAAFFDEVILQGLEVEEIYEEDTKGVKREWAKERDGGLENPTERKRWLVIAVLKRGQL